MGSIFNKSKRIRRVNPAKIYTVDPGILYTAMTSSDHNNGPVFENIVFNALRRNAKSIEYVQTSDEREFDFLVTDCFNKCRLVQASWSLKNPQTYDREINSFYIQGKEMNIEDRIVVTWDEETELENGIRIVPIWKFLLETNE